jgi:predicted enzyme related to lactoylglutathione lyase
MSDGGGAAPGGVTGLGGVFLRPSAQGFMVNFRVASLDATLERLRSAGAEVDAETQHQDGIGRFGWASDPDGNRFELWEPAEGM